MRQSCRTVKKQLNYRQIKESIELLEKAGLIISVVHSSSSGIPLGAQVNFKKRKIILLDTGIAQRLCGKMQSMHIFIKEKQVDYGIRTSLENFAEYDKIKVIPLYAIGNLWQKM